MTLYRLGAAGGFWGVGVGDGTFQVSLPAGTVRVNGTELRDTDGVYDARAVLREGVNVVVVDGFACESLKKRGDCITGAGIDTRAAMASMCACIADLEKRLAKMEEKRNAKRVDWLL